MHSCDPEKQLCFGHTSLLRVFYLSLWVLTSWYFGTLPVQPSFLCRQGLGILVFELYPSIHPVFLTSLAVGLCYSSSYGRLLNAFFFFLMDNGLSFTLVEVCHVTVYPLMSGAYLSCSGFSLDLSLAVAHPYSWAAFGHPKFSELLLFLCPSLLDDNEKKIFELAVKIYFSWSLFEVHGSCSSVLWLYELLSHQSETWQLDVGIIRDCELLPSWAPHWTSR